MKVSGTKNKVHPPVYFEDEPYCKIWYLINCQTLYLSHLAGSRSFRASSFLRAGSRRRTSPGG